MGKTKGKAIVKTPGRPSALLDTRVVYCGDNLEQLGKLPDKCIDRIYIDLRPGPKEEVICP